MSFDPVARLVKELSKLPGIGERTALRLALHLLEQKKDQVISLAESLVDVAQNVVECSLCCNLTAYSTLCTVCSKTARDKSVLCVVASIQDLMAIESSASFTGLYHVLHGVLEPVSGIGPSKLRIKELIARISGSEVKELIMATPSTVEGEATALYITQQIAPKVGLKISRIASGVPVGGELQFVDKLSLSRALALRQNLP